MPWPGITNAWPLGVWVLGAWLVALAIPVTGHAQVDSREGIALQNQLAQLRQDILSLRGEVARGGGNNGDIGAQLLSRVQTMEEQMRQLRGRIDETQNLANRRSAELAKRIDDLTFQLNLQPRGPAPSALPAPPPMPTPPPVREVAPRPEGPQPRAPEVRAPDPRAPELRAPEPRIVMPSLSPPPQTFTFNPAPEPMRELARPVEQPPPPPTARIDPPPARIEPPRPVEPRPRPTPPPEVTPSPPSDVTSVPIAPGGKRTPEMALQEGHAALARRDYAAAERAAREVMGNRASPRAYDGQFLLAEALAGQKQFAQSAIAFDDAYNRSHKGRYAQDALLGLAGALTAINEKRAACDTLSRLRVEFPQVRADLKDAITRTNDRAACAR